MRKAWGRRAANPAPVLKLLPLFLLLVLGSRGGSCRTETWRRREDWSRTRHEMGIGDGEKGLRETGCKLETGLGRAEYRDEIKTREGEKSTGLTTFRSKLFNVTWHSPAHLELIRCCAKALSQFQKQRVFGAKCIV